MKNMIVSHYDLDGISSVINVYNTIKNKDNFQYVLCGYDSLTKTINKLKREEFDILWFTDMNLNKEQLEYALELDCKKIFHFDHHIYQYDIKSYANGKYMPVIDSSMCSTLKLNKWLSNTSMKSYVKNFDYYSKCVNAYDLWLTNEEEYNVGYALNDLFWEYGYEKYFLKFRNSFKLDKEDALTLKLIKKNRDAYIANTLENHSYVNKKASVLYIFNTEGKYNNHFTLLEKYNFYVMMKETNSDKNVSYSIRIYKTDFSLTIQQLFDKIKESGVNVLNSGGHKTVGSITMPITESAFFLETIDEIFEKY